MQKINKGFTIVELLVVIVVIAILVALTLPSLFGLQQRARDTARKNDIKNIQTALESYHNDEGQYPLDLATLVTRGLLEADTTTDPQNNAYTYTGGTCDTVGCETYLVSADLENDEDRDANASGNYEKASVNQ